MSIAEKLQTIAENEQKVFESGKQAEYDRFWDTYQANGNRTDYSNAFAGVGWTSEIFKPKHDIKPINAYMMFRATQLNLDLVEHLEAMGVTLDFSQATNTQYLFNNSQFTRIGIVDVRSSTNSRPLDNTFAQCTNLVTIDKIYLKTGTQGECANTFSGCTALKNLSLEGEIKSNGFDIRYSTLLSKASITSIINALSTTTSGLTVTLSKTAVNNAFETNTGSADGSTSQEWLNLIATKSNWTISLV